MLKRPVNPYIAGKPLTGKDSFFGRSDVLDWVLSELQNTNTNALVLSGQRRIGKTSLLKQLEEKLPPENFLAIYFDLMNQAIRPLDKVLIDLADTVIEKAPMPVPPPSNFDVEGRYFQKTFLPALYELYPNRRPIFLLDEFDVLDQNAEAGLSSVAAARALFPFLRRLMVEDPKPVFVFVVGRRTDDLTIDFNSVFKTSLKREVWVLDPKGARELILQAEANQTLKIKEAAIKHIYELSNGHPYLTQLLCQRIWQHAYQTPRQQIPEIDVAEVDSTIDEALEVGEPALTWLWNGLGPAEKIYAAALAEISSKGEMIPEDRVIQVVSANASRLRTREVELAPRDLVKRRVLQEKDDQKYSFAIELFRLWVRRYKPLGDVKDELDRVSPVAEQLYGIGRNSFNQKEWEDAARFFTQALDRYPQHFRARLYLGETLIELNRLDDAIVELERAYQLDGQEARLPLVRVCVMKAKDSYQKGKEEDALKFGSRALEISPEEYEAKKLLTTIWTKQGDAAQARGDLKAAMVAYRKADAQEKIKGIEVIYRKQEIQRIEKELGRLASAESWDQFDVVVSNGQREFPTEKDWIGYQSQAEVGRKLIVWYQNALTATQKKDRVEALKWVISIINHRPDYKDVPRRFLELVEGTNVNDLLDRYVKIGQQNKEMSDQLKKLENKSLDQDRQILQLRNELEKLRRADDSWSSKLFRMLRSSDGTAAENAANQKFKKTDFASMGLVPPITQTMTTYVLGDDLYDESFSIDTGAGEFLGEYGVGVSEAIGVGEPKKVTALEIWLFDKNDIKTGTKVLMSEHAFYDPNIRARLEPKGDLVMVKPQEQVLLETETLQMLAIVADLEYGVSTVPQNSFFARITLEIAIWPRSRGR